MTLLTSPRFDRGVYVSEPTAPVSSVMAELLADLEGHLDRRAMAELAAELRSTAGSGDVETEAVRAWMVLDALARAVLPLLAEAAGDDILAGRLARLPELSRSSDLTAAAEAIAILRQFLPVCPPGSDRDGRVWDTSFVGPLWSASEPAVKTAGPEIDAAEAVRDSLFMVAAQLVGAVAARPVTDDSFAERVLVCVTNLFRRLAGSGPDPEPAVPARAVA